MVHAGHRSNQFTTCQESQVAALWVGGLHLWVRAAGPRRRCRAHPGAAPLFTGCHRCQWPRSTSSASIFPTFAGYSVASCELNGLNAGGAPG